MRHNVLTKPHIKKREKIRRLPPFARKLTAVLPVLLTLAGFTVNAEVTLPGIFGDNMVLQQSIEVPVWGWADPGDTVTVAIDTLSVETVAGIDGVWSVRLDPLNAGGPYDMIVAGKDSVLFTNVMVGEVWVCSGQSNMAMRMSSVQNIEDDISSADYPDIRLFTVQRASTVDPQKDFPGERPAWVPCSPDTVRSFSAAAYYFGRELQRELKVPIGLVHSSWGGSLAEAWTSLETLRSLPQLRPIVDNLDSLAIYYPQAKEAYDRRLEEWNKARADSLPLPLMPWPPRGPETHHYPAGLYNAMIAPMIPYAIAGVIWYQGESNSVRAYQYRTLFPAMIRDWRKAWGQGDFPFLYIQLANWETDTIPVEGGWGSWAELREAQLMTLSVPNTGMAVTIDIGDSGNIHPNNKWDVGHRLALNALSIAYGRRVVKSGPIYTAMYREGRSIRLRFRHVSQGLVAGSMQPLMGFQIAGADRVFHDAEARIDGGEVIVFSENVEHPVAVRYGWDDDPRCNLYNTDGLPASPFRTDDWPGITEDRLKPLR